MPDEDRIKKLLTSGTETDLEDGLKQLHEEYRMLFWGRLRHWSDQHGYGFTGEDINDLWQETVADVWWNVERGRFGVHGSLEAYLRKIAHCRATDHLRRRRLKIDRNRDLASIAARAGRSVDELREEVKQCIGKLRPKLRLVVHVDVALWFRNGDWPSLQDLTAEVNKRIEGTLTEKAVRTRRARGRRILRRLLEERGYGS